MSGSGGFYRYRCKYFYTHNCPNWVWVNNAACAACLAAGRDSEQDAGNSAPRQVHFARDIFVPRVTDGTIQYTLMEIVASGESGNYWTLRHKVQNPQMMPNMMAVTSDTPNPVIITTGVHRAY